MFGAVEFEPTCYIENDAQKAHQELRCRVRSAPSSAALPNCPIRQVGHTGALGWRTAIWVQMVHNSQRNGRSTQ